MFDLTIAGSVYPNDGVGRHAVSFIKLFHQDLKINLMKFEPFSLKDVKDINVLEICSKPLKEFGKICLFTYILGLDEKMAEVHKKITSPIKIAHSMIESTECPKMWVNFINNFYDLVVVPDEWLIPVYKKSGVTKPIFCLPMGITINPNWWNMTYTPDPNCFVFGMTGGFWSRKNHILTMKAFANKYGGNDKFKLKIHGRFGSYKEQVFRAYQQLNCPNIEFISAMLPQAEYDAFMESISAYLFFSGSEGFSITPREALCMGKPAVISNNSAHKTICKEPNIGIIPVAAEQKIPAVYEIFNNKQIGYIYNPTQADVEVGMEEVYQNYSTYKQQAETAGREWVKQYLWSNLKDRYMSLVKPTKVILGDKNDIQATHIETSDKKLYHKLKKEFNL